MISGASLKAYWMGNYVADVSFHAVAAIMGILGVYGFGIDVPGVEWLLIVNMFANPAFVYFFSFLFDKDETGSLVIKMFYFTFGNIAPIAVSVLQVIDADTNAIGNIMRWFFYPVPIFSISFGYMSIAQRQIIALRNDLDSAEPLSFQVAGLSLIFLLVAVPLFWSLVFAFENKVVDVLLCRKGSNKVDAKASASTTSKVHQRSEAAGLDGALEAEDEEIVLEDERVQTRKPEELPVRVLQVEKNYGTVKAVRGVSFGLEYGECFALLGVSGAGKTSIFKCLTGEIYPTAG